MWKRGRGQLISAEEKKREGGGASIEEKMREGKICARVVRSASASAVSAFASGHASSSASTPDLSVYMYMLGRAALFAYMPMLWFLF
jgi:hypothetical protein